MSEDNFLLGSNFDWNDEKNIDLTAPPEGRKHFAHLLMHVADVTKSYTKGDFFTIPSVNGGQFDDQDDFGLKKFKGWTAGGNNRLFVLVATQTDSEGNPYQIVKQYANQRQRGEKIHLWADKIFPELKKIPQASRNKLTSTGIYVSFDEIPTGQTYKNDEGEEKEIMFWGNYQIFPSKEALDTASEEFFSQFGNSESSEDFWPSTWLDSNSVQDMVDYAKTIADKPHAEIAQELMLNDAVDGEGNPVDIKLVLSKCLDIPETMVKL